MVAMTEKSRPLSPFDYIKGFVAVFELDERVENGDNPFVVHHKRTFDPLT